MSVKTVMKALADEVRELSGQSEAMTINDMTANIEEANSEISGQTVLLNQIATALEGKAGGGGVESGGVGNLTEYAKIVATPASTTSFAIENPLGDIAKKVFVHRTIDTASSSRRCQCYIADFELGIGVAEFIDTSGKVRYPVTKTSGTVTNSNFKMTADAITLYRYNSANAWDNTAEYEVEIYG